MIIPFCGKYPKIDPTAFIVDNAAIIGNVEIGPRANIWFQCTVRGDTNYIRIGARCNIQDACVLHVVKDRYPVILEDDVVLGHRVVVHGCHVGRAALIGIGAIVLDGAKIGEGSIIGAGSVRQPTDGHSSAQPRHGDTRQGNSQYRRQGCPPDPRNIGAIS